MKTSSALRRKALLVVGLLGLVLLGANLMILTTVERIRTSEEAVRTEAAVLSGPVVDLVRGVKEMQFAAVQVQQWLTDISATRGLDGLDDGFQKADAFARDFETASAAARRLAEGLGEAGIVAGIDRVRDAFTPYHATGRRMAEGYVAEGPARGNVLMGEFDATAEAITGALDAVLSAVAVVVDDRRARLVAGIETGAGATSTAGTAALVGTVLGIAGLAFAGFAFFAFVMRPVDDLRTAMQRVADGDLDAPVPHLRRSDEVGLMAATLDVFKSNARERRALADREAAAQAVRDGRSTAVERLIGDLDREVSEVLGAVAGAAAELEATARALGATADATAGNAQAVLLSSERASANVETVASATDELSASVTEITARVQDSSRVADAAMRSAGEAETAVAGLVSSAHQIGSVVSLISDIAGQTNLLALNATIEAARAGEAGKGFAVVATEVKNLATQTTKATSEIGAQIEAMQGTTETVAVAIRGIADTIRAIAGAAAGISGAVTQQGAATEEIAASARAAAEGTRTVASAIEAVRAATDRTGAGVTQIRAASGELSARSETLKASLGRFFEAIRAA